jgi:hypothetical protein
VTTTETLTITVDETVTETTTLTSHQIETETITETETQTVTLNQTITTTSTTTSTSTTSITTTESCSATSTADPNPDPTPEPEPNPGVYGTCTDPTINYVLNSNGQYIYTTNNQDDFPFGESPTIQSPAALICNRLESPCNAPPETVAACRATIDEVSGLEGPAAADAWNAALLGIVG